MILEDDAELTVNPASRRKQRKRLILEDDTKLTVNPAYPRRSLPKTGIDGKIVQAMPGTKSITYSALCTLLAKKYGGRLATKEGARKEVGGCYRRGYILVDERDLTSPIHRGW